MARKRALDDLKETLVKRVAEFLPEGEKLPKELGYNQVKNLLPLTSMAATPREITAFIEYQMGRDEKAKGWSGPFRGQRFGDALLSEITEVQRLAQAKREDDNAFALTVLAQFFGFLAWRAKYTESKKENRTQGGDTGGR